MEGARPRGKTPLRMSREMSRESGVATRDIVSHHEAMSGLEILRATAEAHGYGVRAAYSPPQSAKILGIGENTVYTYIHAGRLRAVRVGRRFYIPATELVRFLEGEQGAPGGEARGR